MKDQHGRIIDYLRISVTDRCNLRCTYCMPESGICWTPHEEILSYEEIIRIVKQAAVLGICHIKITGGEPLVREGVAGLIKELKKLPGLHALGMWKMYLEEFKLFLHIQTFLLK